MASEFYPNGVYNEHVPTIESVLGYALGDRLTCYADLVRYVTALADSSPRVLLRSYGVTYEGRKQYYLIISEPDNLKQIDEIQANVRKLAHPRRLSDEAEPNRIISKTPALVWVGANVHGGEHSTMEAAMLVAYQLAAGEDEQTTHIRRKTVVLIDPLQNPDGRERSVNAFYSAFGVRHNPDPNAAEHNEPWPGGRGNHYLFDLNRDWYPITQQDTVGKVKVYMEWLPQVYIDLHEMGPDSTYFFAPPAEPINKNFPESTRKWWTAYGKAIAEAFDEQGIDYFTAEIFDSFFPGYGESWPALQGAIGMTFEQASARGIAIKRSDETTLHVRDGIQRHFLATMASCAASASRRAELLRDFYDYHQTAIAEGQGSAYIIVPSNRQLDAIELVRNLMLQGIEVRLTAEPFTASAVHNYDGEFAYTRDFPAGCYVIRLDQPRKRLIQALFDREAALDEAFVKEEQARRATRRSGRIYDVTAWAVPLVRGIETYWTNAWGDVPTTLLETPPQPNAPKPNFRPKIAYLLPYTSNAAAKCLSRLLQGGYRAHVSREPFVLNGKPFGRGTLVLKVRDNKPDLHEQVETLTATEGVGFIPSDTSWTDEGIHLGSREVAYLKPPKVAVCYGEPVSSLSYGWMAYLFEQRYDIAFSAVRLNVLAGGNLSDYNAILLPHGSADEYCTRLGEGGVENLRAWVKSGGTLVLIKDAAKLAMHESVKLTSSQCIDDLRNLKPQAAEKTEPKTGAPIPHEFKPDMVQGAILRTQLDPYHFLSYGYGETANVLVFSDYIFTPSKAGHNVATYMPADKLNVSGLINEKMQNALANQAYLIDEPTGKGHVILFADDPNFRGTWDSLTRMFLNSLFFAPSLQR